MANPDIIVGELKEDSRVENAKKNPKRVLCLKDRIFYLIGEQEANKKALSHSDIKFLWAIKNKNGEPVMEKVTVDKFFDLMKR